MEELTRDLIKKYKIYSDGVLVIPLVRSALRTGS
jgi:hypothetical protein